MGRFYINCNKSINTFVKLHKPTPMHQKKWILPGFVILVAITCLTLLSSSSSTDRISPTDNTTCNKSPFLECSQQNDDQEIIQESMSRQFLLFLSY